MLIQDGREVTLNPGDFSLYDTDRPYTLAFSDPHHMVVLLFGRDLLGLPQAGLARLTATRLPGEAGGLATLIGPFLAEIAELLDETGSRDGIRLAGNVLDLLGTVLAERLDCAPPDPDAAHRALMAQITAYIEAHLGEAELARPRSRRRTTSRCASCTSSSTPAAPPWPAGSGSAACPSRATIRATYRARRVSTRAWRHW